MTDFLRNYETLVVRAIESRMTMVLTIKGKPPPVIPAADGYRELLDRLDRAEDRTERS